MKKERFITIEIAGGDADGDIVAFHERERWQTALDSGEWHEYVWQFAESKKQAISQHDEKFAAWRDDVNSGNPDKGTY